MDRVVNKVTERIKEIVVSIIFLVVGIGSLIVYINYGM